jgi:hypothetical protein
MPAGRPFGKVDIVHHLADRYAYRRYLEIATPTTGNYYALIDRARFDECRRLIYRCPAEFDDGSATDYRCSGSDIATAVSAIAALPRRFDVMLVDPFHAYAESARDLAAAFALLEPGGAMVVHDCRPPDESLTGPDFTAGEWCGVTYKAFLDFVLARRDLRYLTVDTDYGCGVVRKLKRRRTGLFDAPLLERWREARERRRLVASWRAAGNDYAAAWRLFEANRGALLSLISVDAFRAGPAALD